MCMCIYVCMCAWGRSQHGGAMLLLSTSLHIPESIIALHKRREREPSILPCHCPRRIFVSHRDTRLRRYRFRPRFDSGAPPIDKTRLARTRDCRWTMRATRLSTVVSRILILFLKSVMFYSYIISIRQQYGDNLSQ